MFLSFEQSFTLQRIYIAGESEEKKNKNKRQIFTSYGWLQWN
jgi:hypothetical protein